MKQKNVLLGIMLLGIIVVAGWIFSKSINAVNLTEGIEPVNSVDHHHLLVLDSLKGKSPEEIKATLNKEWPSIGKDIASWLHSSGRVKEGEKISSLEFFYGSGEGRAEDADGNIHDGYFWDELIAKVIIEGRDEPMMVAVKCSNGLFGIAGELSSVTEDNLVFTVGKRKCLLDYVSYETAISLAETFELPIYRGKGWQRKKISSATAMETDTDRFQVTVLVFPGDEFDLRAMTYNGKRPS